MKQYNESDIKNIFEADSDDSRGYLEPDSPEADAIYDSLNDNEELKNSIYEFTREKKAEMNKVVLVMIKKAEPEAEKLHDGSLEDWVLDEMSIGL